ncbi:MAG: IclR family transcriptional regulator C-terminal domain-containing protein, partial [Dehalococcoidales bacterium]
TENTITEVADIMPELAMVRREGIAIDNQETELGVRCLAAPVKDNNGEIIAAVSVSGPTTRLNIGRVQELKSLVRSTGLEISQEFGYGGN